MFELFHGAVFTILMRSDKPLSLRLFERNVSDGWAAYRVNDEIFLYIKYRTYATSRKGGAAWNFTFAPQEIRTLGKLKKELPVHAVLVCGRRRLEPSKRNMHACLLDWTDLSACTDLSQPRQQGITVLHQAGKSLRVYGGENKSEGERLIVPQNRLEKWDIPGS